MRPRRRTLGVATIVLAVICLADLASTVWLVTKRHGGEANPLMNLFLAHGVYAFVAAKLALSILPLGTLEWARRHRADFVRKASCFAVAAYLSCYGLGVVSANANANKMDYEVPPMLVFRPDGSYRHVHIPLHIRMRSRQQAHLAPVSLAPSEHARLSVPQDPALQKVRDRDPAD